MSSQILEKLKQFPLFKNVPEDRLEQVAQKTLVHEFNRQDYIWNEADISRHLYIIVSGRVKILKHSETGKDVIVEICCLPFADGASLRAETADHRSALRRARHGPSFPAQHGQTAAHVDAEDQRAGRWWRRIQDGPFTA